MKPRIPSACLAVLASASMANAAQAQTLVYDPSAYGKLIEQAQTALRQLDELKAQVNEAQRLYQSLNQASGMERIAAGLSSPQLRAVLPGAQAFAAAARGDLAALGQISARALEIRKSIAPVSDPGEAGSADILASADRAARDAALGEAVMAASAARLNGLQTLEASLQGAPSARAVMDLSARLAAEQAVIANDQMRLQGMAMAQGAEARLAEAEGRATARAASDRRLQLYRSAFQ